MKNLSSDLTVRHLKKTEEILLVDHLIACDLSFGISLSSRVNVGEYAKKMLANGINFGAFYHADELVGHLGGYLSETDSTFFVSNVSVSPMYRRSGIASELMTQAKDELLLLKVEIIELQVHPEQLAAVKLYKKHGFISKGESGQNGDLLLRANLQLH